MIDACNRFALSSQPIEAFAESWSVVTPGDSDRAKKPLMLRFRKNRKFVSTPTTRLKSPLSPFGSRDRMIAPTSELRNRSRRTRATV